MNIVFETEIGMEYRQLLEKVLFTAAQKFKLPKKTEISISFLTKEEIRQVNLSSRNVDKETDVLSFPYLENIYDKRIILKEHKVDINPFTKCLMLGEINICLDKARQQAEEYCHSVERECAYLALHGFLHIIGYDHINEQDKLLMRKAEESILSSLEICR